MYQNIDVLLGKELKKIENVENEQVYFHTYSGEVYKMFHGQDCCEYVYLEDIAGDLDDLLHSPITMAEEITEGTGNEFESSTWTFYKLATNKGYVTLRWLGTSNGYYSESVDFVLLPNDN